MKIEYFWGRVYKKNRGERIAGESVDSALKMGCMSDDIPCSMGRLRKAVVTKAVATAANVSLTH